MLRKRSKERTLNHKLNLVLVTLQNDSLVTETKHSIYDSKLDILSINETWLCEKVDYESKKCAQMAIKFFDQTGKATLVAA